MNNIMPNFGCLEGVRVVVAGGGQASAFCSCLLAENGADTIHIEGVQGMDSARGYHAMFYGNEHRNVRELALDIPSPEGREIFEKLIRSTDILIESTRGGTFANKWDLGDDVLWSWNPKLVIVHISGFGQYGDPAYIARASFDMIGQCFSGLPMLNGTPETGPDFAKPMVSDYYTGFTAAVGALMALYKVQKTGEGDSLDVTQYESCLRCQNFQIVEGFTLGKEPERYSGIDGNVAGDAFYKCSDDRYIAIIPAGVGPMKSLLRILGLEGNPDFEGKIMIFKKDPVSEKFVDTIREFCAERTLDEVEKILGEAGVPCSRLMSYGDMMTNPHYAARNNIIEFYSSQAGRNIKASAPAPQFKRNPQQIWRGGALKGEDSKDIMAELGFTEEEMQQFKDAGAICGVGL